MPKGSGPYLIFSQKSVFISYFDFYVFILSHLPTFRTSFVKYCNTYSFQLQDSSRGRKLYEEVWGNISLCVPYI